ncbi:MAG: hypothetical protein ABW186_07835 [Rhodanobacteraceae bacterium]
MIHDVHRRIARDRERKPWLWVITQDSADYHVCVWKLDAEDVALVEAWERQSTLRRAHGLSELAVPEDRLIDPVPRRMTVNDLNDARTFLTTRDDPALTWHVDEFFHAIDAARYSSGLGMRRALDSHGPV